MSTTLPDNVAENLMRNPSALWMLLRDNPELAKAYRKVGSIVGVVEQLCLRNASIFNLGHNCRLIG
jgi:hypothetical protein